MASVLLALNAAADNDAHRMAVATQAAERMRRIEIPTKGTAGSHETCPNAVALLKRCNPVMLETYTPLKTVGDGNCLFRAV